MTSMNTVRNTRAPVRAYGCPARPTTTMLTMSNPPGRRPDPGNTAILVTVICAATVVVLGIIGGAVALSLAGSAAGDIVALFGPIAGTAALVVAALGQLVGVRRQQEQQQQQLEQVVHQTNGGLKDAVADAVNRTLDQRQREGRL